MILVCDEGVDRPIVDRLRGDDHEVVYIAEQEPGATDEDVLAAASERGALLVTTDKDFGELAPGANGQGRTKQEARQSLADAIGLILEDRRIDGVKDDPTPPG